MAASAMAGTDSANTFCSCGDPDVLHHIPATAPRRVCVASVILVLALAGAPLVHAQNGTEADVKAAFLLNFAKFVEWPAEVMASNGPITACVVGSPTVASALVRAMQGRSISGHDVVVSN